MYIPEPFHETDTALALDFIRRYPFGTLTGIVNGQLWSVHLPFTIAVDGDSVRLQAHLAKANKLSQSLTDCELLINFLGLHSYVSPSWYTHDKHYPTWIYAAVHVYGQARILGESELEAQVLQLISEHELGINFERPWNLSVMPEELTTHFKKMIVGFEVSINRIETCFKLNQHKQREDIDAMVKNLRLQGDSGRALAEITLQATERSDAAKIVRYLDKYKIND